MTSSPRGRSAPVVLKDSYGFVVKRDYHDLFKQYAPIWVKEEVERSNLWASFLLSFAPDKARETAAEFSEKPRLDAACEHGLQPFQSALAEWRAQDHSGGDAPTWLPQLRSLVQAGLPRILRGRLWQSFLGIHVKREAGTYDSLVHKALGGTKYGRKRSGGAPSAQTEDCSYGPSHNTSNGSAAAAAEGNASASAVSTAATSDCPPATDSTAVEASAAPTATVHAHEVPQEGSLGPERSLPEPTPAAASATLPEASSEPVRRRRGPQPWHPSTNDWNVQIEKDLHRTFPGHPLMNRRGRCALRRILAAYSRRNDSVGYCQGMNFVAGAMLLFMGEEEAFWCLCAIVEDLLPGYFSHDLIAPQVDQLVFKHMVEQRFPTLCAHLSRHSVNVSSMAVNWFLTIFVTSLPLESTLRVWDVLFFDSCASVLFRCSLALVDIYAQALMATVDSIDAFSLLHCMAPMSFDASRLIDMACIAFSSLTIDQIQSLRTAYRTTIIASKRNDGSSDEDAAWTASDDDAVSIGAASPSGIDTPSAIVAEGDFYYDTGSDEFSDNASGSDSPTAGSPSDVATDQVQRSGGLEDVREYVSAINSSAAAGEGVSGRTPQKPEASAAEGPRRRRHGSGSGHSHSHLPDGRGSGSASRDGGLHAAMGAASAVSKQMKFLATPASARRSLFGRTGKRSVQLPAVSGAVVLGASAEDDVLGSNGCRSTLAAEAAYHIAATPFKTPPRGETLAGGSPRIISTTPIDLAASGSMTAALLPPAGGSAEPAPEGLPVASGIRLGVPASAADRARRHIQEASSVVARSLNNSFVGQRSLEASAAAIVGNEAAAGEEVARHAAAMAQVLAVVEGLEEELHAAEAACRDAEMDAHSSGRNAKDARRELETAIAELQEKATVVDRLHDKLLGVTNTLAFFDSQLQAKEQALSTVRVQVAERDANIAQKDTLIAQLQANQIVKRETAVGETTVASPLAAPSPSTAPSSFFRKFRSAASSDGGGLPVVGSGGSMTGSRWRGGGQTSTEGSLRTAAQSEPTADRVNGTAAATSALESRDLAAAADSAEDAHADFQPRNLDEALPPKPKLQPLIISTIGEVAPSHQCKTPRAQ